ncbi:MAG: HEPN domain-containing protein [Bacteroidales bacterium]|nr:HEPN domain-containing protein [Bacteroidales bacterium]
MTTEDKNEMIAYRIKRAKETLNEIQILIDHSLWTTAINRTYYACYYAVSALLLKNDIKSQTHSGTRQMFGLHFIKENKISKEIGNFFSDIFDMRHSGDYDDFVEFSEEDVLDVFKSAKELISAIEDLIK